MKRFFAFLLMAAMLCAMVVPAMAEGNDTLVLGSTSFNGVFSPFFSRTAYDTDIYELVHAALYSIDRGGMPSDGIATYQAPEEIKDADGNTIETIYTFTLIDDVVFSDGTPITADDVLFSFYVFLDPNYDGASTMFALPIRGLQNYRYDDPDAAAKVAEVAEKVAAITEEQVIAYITAAAPADVAGATLDDVKGYFVGELGGEEGYAAKLAEMGITDEQAMTQEQMDAIYVGIEIANYYAYYVADAKAAYKAELEAEVRPDFATLTEAKVPEIEGIKKIDDRTVQVTLDGIDPTAIFSLGIPVVPKAYYGEGFKKGVLDGVKAVSGAPVGGGAYIFESFENNVVSLKANPLYYKGEPQIPFIRYQVINNDSDKVQSIILGDMDISDPTSTDANIEQATEAGLHIEMIDNLGYGYVGINAERISDINIRKGLMHLMDREPAVRSYYKDRATVIERPMSTVSWAYPEGVTEFYGYDPARSLEYFQAAGYVQEGEGADLKLVKDGVQMHYNVCVGGDGRMDHPSAQVLINMKTEMEKMGAVLDILDIDFSIISDGVDNGDFDMFCMAWQSTSDPDMYQVYHSEGPTNHYRVRNAELDDLIVKGRSTTDIEKRKEYYARALDIIMEEAVEMPVYQRKNMFVFNPAVVNIDTLPEDMTPFYGYFAELETLELVK